MLPEQLIDDFLQEYSNLVQAYGVGFILNNENKLFIVDFNNQQELEDYLFFMEIEEES